MEEKRDYSELAKAVASAVRSELSTLTVPEETHYKHHEFIEEWLAETRLRRERNEKIKTHVMGWGIVALISGIGTGAYNTVHYLREHLK